MPVASWTEHAAMYTRFSGSRATVIVSGELDIRTAPTLRHVLDEVLDKRPESLVLDLTEVTFIDCASARLLAAASRALPGARGAVISQPGYLVDQVLRLTGMSDYLRVEEKSARSPAATAQMNSALRRMVSCRGRELTETHLA